MTRLTVAAAVALLSVRVCTGQALSADEAQQRLAERQRIAAVAATQPANLLEENRRLKSELAALRQTIVKLTADLAAAKASKTVLIPTRADVTIADARAAVHIGMSLIEIKELFGHVAIESDSINGKVCTASTLIQDGAYLKYTFYFGPDSKLVRWDSDSKWIPQPRLVTAPRR